MNALVGKGAARRRGWLLLALTAFALRSLIPMGFMPSFGPGFSVGLMLCEGYAAIAPAQHGAMDMPMAASMDMSMQTRAQHHADQDPSGGRSPVPQNHSACPYGASPVLADVAMAPIVGPALERLPGPALPAAQLTVFASIPRAQSPRAPPINS
jgi:hypothetical protein